MMRAVRTLARRELVDSVRTYWFLIYSGVLIAGGVLLMVLGGAQSVVLGYRGFARAIAGLMHLALFVVPLMALFPAASALAGEREIGSLDYLLAQPVSRFEVYIGKWLGVWSAVILSLTVGFGVTGIVASVQGVSTRLVLALFGFTVLLATAFASFGLWLSAASPSTRRATTIGLTGWLIFLALGSFGVMGAFIRWGLPSWVLAGWALVNPIETCRLALVSILDSDRALLGPVGVSLLDRLGRGGLALVSATSLVGWSAVGAIGGAFQFHRRER